MAFNRLLRPPHSRRGGTAARLPQQDKSDLTQHKPRLRALSVEPQDQERSLATGARQLLAETVPRTGKTARREAGALMPAGTA